MPDELRTITRNTQIIDGNQAAAHVAYAYSEAAAIYPITPSSPMAELCDEWAEKGRKNIYGQTMVLSQMQSEAGAAAAVHGAALAGTLATTFTASQGLLLMLPNLYRMTGELLPCVIHVAARTIATHALSIFGDHSDIYACRQTGMAIFCESSVQEVMDLSPVAHLAAIEGSLPFLNFFDGFRTSHELCKVDVWEYETLREMLDMDAVENFRARSLHPHHGRVYGSAQNPDIFFQAREASNPFYQALPEIVERQLAKINHRLGTRYGLFDYYGSPEAEHVIIAMGSICETVKEYLDSVPDRKYGLIIVHLYRPFSARHLIEKLPKSVRLITVLDRTKEPGAPGEPLYLDVVAALTGSGIPVSGKATADFDTDQPASQACHDRPAAGQTCNATGIRILSGRYGLSSKDTTPAQIAAIYENRNRTPFTAGITDDVTHLSLEIPDLQDTAPADIVSCKFWGLGGDGTVSATKNAIKIIGAHTDRTVQGYFEYDSKKSRGLTISHLRFGKSPIRSAYLIHRADFVACHNPAYLHKYDMVSELKDGGTFLLNFHFRETPLEVPALSAESEFSPGKETSSAQSHNQGQNGTVEAETKQGREGEQLREREQIRERKQIEELESYLPSALKAFLAEHHIRLFVIDALGIGKEIGLNNKISTILQAAFFAVSGLLEPEKAKQWMVEAAKKSYGKSGGTILEMNRQAIERGLTEGFEVKVPESWRYSGTSGQSKYASGSNFASDHGGGNNMAYASEPGCHFSSLCNDNHSFDSASFQRNDKTTAHAPESGITLNLTTRPEIKAAPASSTGSGTEAALDNTPLPDRPEMMDFVRNIQQPVTDQRGNTLPVSAFLPYADGYTPPGSTAHERRGVATEIPVWKPENCIQCARCSYVCPHAVIRPAALTEEQIAGAPEGMKSIPMFGMDGYSFAITVSRTDCTGCGTCAAICPGKPKKPGEEPSRALEMVPVTRLKGGEDSSLSQAVFDYCKPLLPCKEAVEKFRPDTLKGSQFLRPLMEFSGACAGCGETAYVKLLTQLFGDRMYIANATGCSSIWGNSAPSCAYAVDGQGYGPAWSNSLFEDAAEFGYGMLMAREAAARLGTCTRSDTLPANGSDCRTSQVPGDTSAHPADPIPDNHSDDNAADSIPDNRSNDDTAHTIQWIIGGDGWAYDIGFSGLDHVLASGKDINILVLDTEVYSNTGGQASKATPTGSTAKFATGGKKTAKKDLASMAMTYGNIYVAQIAMGADLNQTLRAFTEAAAYPGPSLIIAYATCIAHGIRAGMGSTPHEAKKAVDAGYFHLFRFNPALREQNKNPFVLDSGEPKLDYTEFLEGEIRYGALERSHPEEAKELFQRAAAQAKRRYRYLKGLEALYAPENAAP